MIAYVQHHLTCFSMDNSKSYMPVLNCRCIGPLPVATIRATPGGDAPPLAHGEKSTLASVPSGGPAPGIRQAFHEDDAGRSGPCPDRPAAFGSNSAHTGNPRY